MTAEASGIPVYGVIWGSRCPIPAPALLTLLWEALRGRLTGTVLHIPILQHLVVGGQAAEPQLVYGQQGEKGRSDERSPDPKADALCPPAHSTTLAPPAADLAEECSLAETEQTLLAD